MINFFRLFFFFTFLTGVAAFAQNRKPIENGWTIYNDQNQIYSFAIHAKDKKYEVFSNYSQEFEKQVIDQGAACTDVAITSNRSMFLRCGNNYYDTNKSSSNAAPSLNQDLASQFTSNNEQTSLSTKLTQFGFKKIQDRTDFIDDDSTAGYEDATISIFSGSIQNTSREILVLVRAKTNAAEETIIGILTRYQPDSSQKPSRANKKGELLGVLKWFGEEGFLFSMHPWLVFASLEENYIGIVGRSDLDPYRNYKNVFSNGQNDIEKNKKIGDLLKILSKKDPKEMEEYHFFYFKSQLYLIPTSTSQKLTQLIIVDGKRNPVTVSSTCFRRVEVSNETINLTQTIFCYDDAQAYYLQAVGVNLPTYEVKPGNLVVRSHEINLQELEKFLMQ